MEVDYGNCKCLFCHSLQITASLIHQHPGDPCEKCNAVTYVLNKYRRHIVAKCCLNREEENGENMAMEASVNLVEDVSMDESPVKLDEAMAQSVEGNNLIEIPEDESMPTEKGDDISMEESVKNWDETVEKDDYNSLNQASVSNKNKQPQNEYQEKVKRLCIGCGKFLCNKYYLREHQKKFPGKHSFTCEICNSTFTRPNRFLKHLANHQQISIKMELAKSLNLPFESNNNSNVSETDKVFVCYICPKAFFSVENYHYHKRTCHSSAQTHSKVSKQNSRIQAQNFKFDEGQRLHFCLKCTKKFVLKVQLLKHSMVHFTNKNFQCWGCPRKFKSLFSCIAHFKACHTSQ